MTQLTVSVSGSWSESRLLTLPVDVYASDGSILASGTASPSQPGHGTVCTYWASCPTDRRSSRRSNYAAIARRQRCVWATRAPTSGCNG